jgi:hypothetical protein
MSNQKTDKPDSSLGNRLLEALTQGEIAGLLDAIFAVLSPDTQRTMLDQLSPDTRRTVRHVLSRPQESDDAETLPGQPVSIAKLEQTWHKLWGKWDTIVDEASNEEGDYIAQEAHWEPPYFDQYAFAQDLEKVAETMRPLIQSAIEHRFEPDMGFAEAISEAEDAIAAGMPEWIYLDEGFDLEANLTHCLLTWEWLKFKEANQKAFAFAELILEWEDGFAYASLDSNTLLEFFTELPETDQKEIFDGLSQNKDAGPWKSCLDNVHDHWHILYLHYVDEFAPERYLDNLRPTIPNQWRNGLPVIEDLLVKQDYEESLKVMKETLSSLLKYEQVREAWTPETVLLCPLIQRHDNDAARLQEHKTLLDYYQQISKGLGQSELVKALSLQLITFEHCFDWEAMFKAFAETPVSEQVRQALFASWREYIIRRAKPSTWSWGRDRTKPHDIWWLHWLIDSIVDGKKGPTWFQQQMVEWLIHLPGKKQALGEDYGFLRLLTKDLSEIDSREQDRYPQFYEVVIRSGELRSPDQASRRAYLKQYASDDLMYQVMGYWQAYLKNFVPKPENAHKSNYTEHAHWMVALRELAPDSYETLRHKWGVDHHRRRNLWKAMAKVGLK